MAALEFAKALRHILLALLVLLLLFSGICFSSSNSENYNDKSMPCFERYIVESYFGEYDSLMDSNFQDFVAHRLRLMDLERHLIGEGYHRRLSSSIRFSIDTDLISEFSSQLCEFISIERLPYGVFADAFELEHLIQHGKFMDACVFGDTNLELPAFLSNRSIVEVHHLYEVPEKSSLIVHEIKIDIPLHARYPNLEESGYSKVIFGVPDLSIRCKMHGKLPPPSCLLSPFVSNDSLKLDDVVWSIPAGIKAHAGIVSAVTFTSALLSAISIIIVSFRYSSLESDERLKQS